MIGEDLCNVTNASTAMGTDDEAVPLSRKYYSSQAEFTLPVLQQFGIGQTIDFFHVLKLPLTKLKEGLMYPMSLQAASVVDVFELALEERNRYTLKTKCSMSPYLQIIRDLKLHVERKQRIRWSTLANICFFVRAVLPARMRLRMGPDIQLPSK